MGSLVGWCSQDRSHNRGGLMGDAVQRVQAELGPDPSWLPEETSLWSCCLKGEPVAVAGRCTQNTSPGHPDPQRPAAALPAKAELRSQLMGPREPRRVHPTCAGGLPGCYPDHVVLPYYRGPGVMHPQCAGEQLARDPGSSCPVTSHKSSSPTAFSRILPPPKT